MKILAFGDSLTEGYVTKETARYHPYTTTLKRLLSKNKKYKTTIDNQGVSGEKTGSMIKRIKTIGKTFDMVILLAGTNDLNDSKMSVSAIVKNVIELHRLCRTRLGASKTLCLSLPEVTNGKTTGENGKLYYNSKREQVNRKLQDHCRKTVDMYYVPFGEVFSETQLAGMGLFSGNGYHLSAKGYQRMAEFIALYISFII
jgi:lysophospholipase L1-like esterase